MQGFISISSHILMDDVFALLLYAHVHMCFIFAYKIHDWFVTTDLNVTTAHANKSLN